MNVAIRDGGGYSNRVQVRSVTIDGQRMLRTGSRLVRPAPPKRPSRPVPSTETERKMQEIQDYIWNKRQIDRWYSPYTDKVLMSVAQQVVMDNMESFDIANKGKNPDQNISEDDFKAVAKNKNSQYNELQIWAAKLLLSNDTKVSDEDREKVFAGEADPAAYGWKLWSWKKEKSFWEKAVDFVVQVVKIGVGFLPYADCLSAGLSLVQGNGIDAMDAAGCAADLLTGGVGGKALKAVGGVADGVRAADGARAADAFVHSDELFGATDEIADMAKMGDEAGSACSVFAALHSFSGDTKVLMADGSTKAIADIELGDEVLAQDPDSSELVAREVTTLFEHDDVGLVDLIIGTEDGVSTVSATGWHPVYSDTRDAFVEVDQLHKGERLRTDDGDEAWVLDIVHRSGVRRMYDLTVDTTHTYFVNADTQPILVHNNTIDPEECVEGAAKVVKSPRYPSSATRRSADDAARAPDGSVRCQYCGELTVSQAGSSASREYDHVLAYKRGGSSLIDNIRVACRRCNRSKGAKLLADWLLGR